MYYIYMEYIPWIARSVVYAITTHNAQVSNDQISTALKKTRWRDGGTAWKRDPETLAVRRAWPLIHTSRKPFPCRWIMVHLISEVCKRATDSVQIQWYLWRTKISNHVWVKRSIPCTRKNRTIECLNITIDMSLNGKTTKTKPTKKDLWLIDVGSFESRLFLTLELEIPNDKLSLDAVQEQSRFIHVAKRHQKTWWVCNKIEENCV